jgi:hypothetical protein
MKMPRNSLPQTKSAYYWRLKRFVVKYFQGSPWEPKLDEMLHEFEARDMRREPLPRHVLSTDEKGLEGAPEGFGNWSRVVREEDGWVIEVLNHEMVEMRMREYVHEGEGARQFGKIWDSINFQVLKTDVIRQVENDMKEGCRADRIGTWRCC